MNRDQLNDFCAPLHRAGIAMLKAVRALGYKARLCYCNLHEVKVEGGYQTEYFPLPEVEIRDGALSADLGIALDGSVWLEVTLSRDEALALDFEALAARAALAVYGTEQYLNNFLKETLPPAETAARIRQANESHIHLCFSLPNADAEAVRALLEDLAMNGMIGNPR
jgi:hypothetical protein